MSSVLAAASLWLVLRLTWRKDSFHVLDGYDYRFLALGGLCLFLSWLADGWRITWTIRAAGYGLAFRHGLRSVMAGHFLSAVTPFLAGGAPLQVYSLYRAGVPSGAATAVVLASGLVAQGLLVIGALALTLWPGSPLAAAGEGLIGVALLRWATLAYAGGLVVFFLLVWHGRAGAERIVEGLARAFASRGSGGEAVHRKAAGPLAFLGELNDAFRHVVQRRPRAALAAAVGYLLHFFLYFSIAAALLKGIDPAQRYGEALLLQLPVYLLASIVPTPGGSGGIEAGMGMVFAPRLPEAALGVFIVGWRLLTYYGQIVGGGIAAASLLRTSPASPPGESPAAEGEGTPEDRPSSDRRSA